MTGTLGELEPVDASEYDFAIVVSRFNAHITDKLLDGAQRCFAESRAGSVEVFHVPGAFELPLAAKLLAQTDDYDAIVCLGCVIRGDTPHFDFVAGEAARGIGAATLATEIPMSFGVLTTNTEAQALERCGDGRDNKGWEAARTAIEMALFADALATDEGVVVVGDEDDDDDLVEEID